MSIAIGRRRKLAIGIGLPTVLVAGLAAAGLAASRRDRRAETTPQPRATVDRRRRPRGDRRGARATAPPEATVTPDTTEPQGRGQRSRSAKGPDGVAVSGGKVFVANQQGGTLTRDRPRDRRGRSANRSTPGTRPDGIVAGKGVVWLASAGSDEVARFQADGEIVPTAKVPVGDRPEAISLGKQLVWVANLNDNTVNRIDRATPSIVGDADRRRLQARRDLRRPPLRVGDQLRRRHRHADRPVDRARSSATRSASGPSRAA